MKDEQSASKGNPIIIASTGMRIAVDYRRGTGGDEGLTLMLPQWVKTRRENSALRLFQEHAALPRRLLCQYSSSRYES
jgi:hypothetical protein